MIEIEPIALMIRVVFSLFNFCETPYGEVDKIYCDGYYVNTLLMMAVTCIHSFIHSFSI